MYKRQVNKQTVLGYDALGTFLMKGEEDGSNVADPPKQIEYMLKTSTSSPRTICEIYHDGTNPINDCTFVLTTPTNGAAKLILMAQFVNSSLAAVDQALPVTRLEYDVTIGTDSGNLAKTVEMPYAVIPTGNPATNVESFSITLNYTRSNLSLIHI